MNFIELEWHSDHTLSLWLNRPDKFNALSAAMINQLRVELNALAKRSDIKLLIIRAHGKHFCAGADINEMADAIECSESENIQQAKNLSEVYELLNNFPAPVVCVCQGKSLGGGFGLVCCCDYRIGITNTDCQFSLSEVKLGLAPAVIVPYLIDTLGPRLTRRFCLTAEIINDSFALELRLLDERISAAQLDIRLSELRRTFECHGTTAMAAGKLLINSQKHFTSQQQRLDACVQTIARLRVSPQGQEGCRAFLEKRPPRW